MRFDIDLVLSRENEDIIYPTRSNDNDCGLDVYAPVKTILLAKSFRRVDVGLRVKFPDDYMLLIQGRSGLAHREGVFTIGNVIDPGYRGVIGVCLVNMGSDDFIVEKGSRIAQLVLIHAPVPRIIKISIDQYLFLYEKDSDRSTDGFGSTGK